MHALDKYLSQKEPESTQLHASTFDTVIVRFGGEIGIKAPFTRRQYERRLTVNIKASLKHHALPYSALSRTPGRLYIRTNKAEETAQKLSKVFGIASLSPSFTTSSNLDEILNASTQLASRYFKRGDSFAVRCHRVGRHSYTSQEICGNVGEHVLTSLKTLKLTVDLTDPKRTLQLEIRDKKAYLFTDVTKGPGGLPLGTQPKLICLLKGDVPSTVACWMTMKRGCPQVLLHIDESLTQSRKGPEQPATTAETLMDWSIGFPARLRISRLDRGIGKALEIYPPELAMLVRKRLMLRIAKRVAEATRAEGIVTGDSFREASVNSVHSFRILDEAAKGLPVYRPLLGLDDEDIDSMVNRIGLKETTMERAEQPSTRAAVGIEGILEIEQRLKPEKIVDDALESMQIIELTR
jgi:thiamine biosynthesis protein ThiI